MKVIITGASGTLAPYIIKVLKQKDIQVVIWDRDVVAIDQSKAIDAFMDQVKPDYFLHIATGPIDWLKEIVSSIKERQIPLLFTSTVSVFSDEQTGPFAVEDKPLSESDYGLYKQACEDYIKNNYGDKSLILRLGWQIALEPKKNNMLTYLVGQEEIHASTAFIPATSFMHESAKVIVSFLEDFTPGLYQFDQNIDNLSFYEIASKMNELFSLEAKILQSDSPKINSRMKNNVPKVSSLDQTIKNLKRVNE
jgi:dTDP-4-dehydrorhamnose reductase